MDISNSDPITSLIKRQTERKQEIQKKQNEKKLANAEHEQYDYFKDVFAAKLNEIELQLDQSPDIEPKEIPFHFDKISKDIYALQKLVAHSVLFLRHYDIRKCQEALSAIEIKAHTLEEKLLPKKKFGFKKKRAASATVAKKETTNGALDVCDSLKKPERKYEDNFFGFRNERNKTLALIGETIQLKDVSMQNLEKCVVTLQGVPSTLHMSCLTNCVILCGPVATSVFIENCVNCKFILACQQLRLHSSKQCDIYLHVTSKAIIEDSSRINVAPYNYDYDTLNSDFNAAGLDTEMNHWNTVDDFNWLVLDKQSPNWSILEQSNRIANWDNISLSDL